ncbi:BRCA1-associated ATM activator 1 isoform X1 [Thunnus albacares]|uniref:BRCA1-associated ATM activator 1 isoform X1 n=1 Tax=Thunnus albacares TaxID=8236 RepID=UPI001CF6FD3A|nr:BRCA1-associated ATM activator 1 isoform X1 [Thunnus albacares]
MDRECVSLLPRVCEVLADSGKSLPDDTSLEKLLDWFTEAGGSLLETCPCLFDFISTVINNTDSDPSVLSFTLRLSGLMAAAEDGFKMLQECSVLDLVFNVQRWQEAGLWEDPCIRIGWILGLRSTLQHPKALSFFVESDFIKPLLQLQTDTSLFVASAANQMLAHILLFFQPVSPARCNGIDKKDEYAERTYGGIKEPITLDPEHPALTMETSTKYTAVVMAISEYLKESLVPKENTQLHQSLQILKLLALLLAQARPPLRDTLLQTVADSLEQLATAGYSQLTLPLMDVILAANSSSGTDERVAHLLSSMLNINKPADLIHAAAAFLRRGRLDTVHTAQAVRMLLLPLNIITGQTLLGTDTAADEHRFLMVEQLKNKTSCISMICICLTNTPQITLMPPDVLLTCPPVSVVLAVLSLLRICSGDSSSSSTGCREVYRNVIGSGKVQKCALEALTALGSSPGAKDKMKEVFMVLIQYLDNPDSDPTVIHKSYKALIKWMSVCADVSSITDQLRQDLIRVVQKRVCDMRWEVRDSTLEFLGQLAGVHVFLKSAEEESCRASEALLGGCCTNPLLKEALQDPESYVRASATSALAQTLAHSWQQGAALTQEQTEIVSRLLEILSEDTEGFARRAVVQYFIAWFSSRSSHTPPSSSLLMNSVRSVLSKGSVDLDWEVKVHTLQLAELLLDEAFSGHRGYKKSSDTDLASLHPYAVVSDQAYTLHTHSLQRTNMEGSDSAGVLSNLVEQGVLSALLSGLVDCDRPVGLKACRLLITLRETVCPLSQGAEDATSPMATVARVSCELPGWGWGQEIRKILERKKYNQTKEADIAACTGEVDSGEAEEEGESDRGNGVCVSVCEVLRSLGLDERLDVLTQSSDHVHNSLLSLLQDILTASAAHTHPDTEEGQEVIVDCY